MFSRKMTRTFPQFESSSFSRSFFMNCTNRFILNSFTSLFRQSTKFSNIFSQPMRQLRTRCWWMKLSRRKTNEWTKHRFSFRIIKKFVLLWVKPIRTENFSQIFAHVYRNFLEQLRICIKKFSTRPTKLGEFNKTIKMTYFPFVFLFFIFKIRKWWFST